MNKLVGGRSRPPLVRDMIWSGRRWVGVGGVVPAGHVLTIPAANCNSRGPNNVGGCPNGCSRWSEQAVDVLPTEGELRFIIRSSQLNYIMAVGENGAIVTSPLDQNDLDWTLQESGTQERLNSVSFGQTPF